MTGLYVGKMRIATKMQSRSLRAEAMESLFCDLQDLTILVGLGLNSLFSWWWADPVSALFLVPFFVKEGLENFSDHGEEHENHGPRVCFCRSCFYGLRRCRATCCLSLDLRMYGILSGPLGTCLVAAALLSSIKDAVDRKAHVLFGVSTIGNVCR